MRHIVVASIAVVVVLGIALSASGERTLSVHFIDVGQGDAILIDYGEYEALIDGGRDATCSNYLGMFVDGSLEVLIATHMDADHIGGLDEVLSRYEVESIWTNGNANTTIAYNTFAASMNSEGCPITQARVGDTIHLADLDLDVLHPSYIGTDANNNSVVLSLSFMGWEFLFTGDIDSTVEEELVTNGLGPVDILKVAHHGSKYSTSSTFLRASQPRVCVISVGTNPYGHPSTEVLHRIGCDLQDPVVFRTDIHGTVVLSVTNEGKAYYRTEYDADPLSFNCLPSSPPQAQASFQIFSVEAVAECISLVNRGSATADLGGWTISDGEGSYTFPSGTLVEPGAVYTVCMDTYNPTHYTRGLYLNNQHDCVLLFAPDTGWDEYVDSRCW